MNFDIECVCPCRCGCRTPEFTVNDETGYCSDCDNGSHELPPRSIVEKLLPVYKQIVLEYEKALEINLWEGETSYRFNGKEWIAQE